MAKRQKIIMAWSKCTIEIAPTGADDAFNGTELKSIGVIKDKSTTLEPSDGDALEMKATGRDGRQGSAGGRLHSENPCH